MSYDKQSLMPVLSVRKWFDRVAKEYRQYRSHLTSVDHNQYKRFLPRDLTGYRILDLGAGDGRIFEHFKNLSYDEYIALDISPKMLDRFQSSAITKIIADSEEWIPCDDESIDLICMFFFIEYIADINYLFQELSRILKSWATCVATYFHQRHSFVFWHAEDAYKIERYSHTYEQIITAASDAFLEIEEFPIIESGKMVWYIYEFKKV